MNARRPIVGTVVRVIEGPTMSKDEKIQNLVEAILVVLSHLAPDSNGSRQHVLYSDALGPDEDDDDQTIVEYLQSVITINQ